MDAAHLLFADHALRYREPIGGRAARRGDVLRLRLWLALT